MSKFTNSTGSTTDSTTSKIPSPTGYNEPKVEPKTEESNPGVDDFGYATPEVKPEPKVEDKKPVEDDKPIEKAATGYAKTEEVKPEPKVEDKKPADEVPPTDEEKVKKELTEAIKDLPETVDKEKVSKFALENKLTKEQLQAYTELVKEDQKNFEISQKEAVQAQRTEWKNELVNDPEFGGENFDKNVDRVEKVLEKYMPNMKKVLTERGTMLPPYIMRDFLALSKVLNPTTTLVMGNPSETENDSKNFLDEMYE